LAAPTPTIATRHVGDCGGLVDKHQFQRVEIELTGEPFLTPPQDIRAILLARVRRLLLSAMAAALRLGGGGLKNGRYL
jgi:hypothetical protein